MEWLARIDRWQHLTGEQPDAWRVDPRSALAGDDAKTDPYQVSHAAWHALTVAVDHLGCLKSSLLGDVNGERAEVRIHTHAQSSLIRGAIENAARAVWLVGPKDRLTRISRPLALQAKETRDSFRMRALVQQPAAQTQEQRLQRLTGLLIAAGTPEEQTKAALKNPAYSHIVRGAGDLTPLGADVAQVVWSGCSALAHGDAFGTLSILDRQIVAKAGDVATIRITGSISSLFWCTVTATVMIEQGFQLYRQRSACHR
ncbi:hypothetical protein AB0C27_42340 [Nonomuraea sp. NPDC048882]|uniref:hypothetical protein n=1 Tax=Nonomuraea sp. NPDC048882 TaxID=3154347 RepID=UPI00340195D3